MSTSSPATKKCFNCSKLGNLRCSKCKGLCLCGRDCQVATWKSHKHLCKAISRNPNATCLLLDGMGPLGPGEFYAQNVQKSLQYAGVEVAVVNVLKGSKVPEQVGSILSEVEKFSSCIILGWGSGGCDIETEFGNSKIFRDKAVSWVNSGGRFIVQGERPQGYGNWPEWFGKSWESSDYFRTDYACNGKSDNDIHWCKWYHKAKGAVTTTRYNAKTVMLSGVAPEDNLFSTSDDSRSYSLVPMMSGRDIEGGQSAVAVGKYGEGSVSYFGDVNAEDETCDVMAIIARGK
ncbi:hypothetical protein QTG54_016257 [Skeletonema marinoi]|uniref:MYND-type domain-containing protein n=1 Tax=Skeletonema marinoi TaxID=267567 RepID=A0AAD8XSN5_9STRA|nr:hypothetical protein QTG54_016257 [Skeletonema marinoi]|mmetsp:Transcript_17981/g.36110  ORF Transcript_17981/g.36110 Transcript_17981/m.36110 type:complete len:289 (+) Transcript_17981:112-978(+)